MSDHLRRLVVLMSALLATFGTLAQAQTSDRVAPDVGAGPQQTPSPASAWVISETTSPVDYSPQIAAATRAVTSAKGAAAAITIRCRGKRTELWIHSDGSWPAARANLLQVETRINAEPAARTTWLLSADGRAALFSGDAMRFLRTIPDQAKLELSVIDAAATMHQAVFDLTGMDAVRKKIGSVC